MKRNWLVTVRYTGDMSRTQDDRDVLVENKTFEEMAALAASLAGYDAIGPPGPRICIGSREIVAVRMTSTASFKAKEVNP